MVALLSTQGQKALGFHQKYLNLCSKDQGSEPVQGTKTKTGNKRNFDRNRTRTRNEIKFYSSEQNKKIEMAINWLITLFYRSI